MAVVIDPLLTQYEPPKTAHPFRFIARVLIAVVCPDRSGSVLNACVAVRIPMTGLPVFR